MGVAPTDGTTVTATLCFIRHAAHDHLGRILSGRTPGIPLSPDGRGQAVRLARALSGTRFAAIYTSPVQRARETAEALAADRDCPVVVADALDEIDFGAWTGRAFAQLESDAGWDRWNAARGSARCPGGETMAEAGQRAVAFAGEVAARHAGAAVALVSHCDVIRAAMAHWLGLDLDHALNFDVDPASLSRVAVGDWGGRILSLNEAMA